MEKGDFLKIRIGAFRKGQFPGVTKEMCRGKTDEEVKELIIKFYIEKQKRWNKNKYEREKFDRDPSYKKIKIGDKKCLLCNSTEKLERHHIDGNACNGKPENVAILCRNCHVKKAHVGRWWINEEVRDQLSRIKASIKQVL